MRTALQRDRMQKRKNTESAVFFFTGVKQGPSGLGATRNMSAACLGKGLRPDDEKEANHEKIL